MPAAARSTTLSAHTCPRLPCVLDAGDAKLRAQERRKPPGRGGRGAVEGL